MKNAIGREFHFWSLLRFALPTMIMMIFMSLYTIVDGFFVSRFVGTNALSAINIVYPAIGVIFAVGIMLATGGSAVVAKKFGEGKFQEANENFSFIILFGVVAGAVIAVAGILLLEPLVQILGATPILEDDCRIYLLILLAFGPAGILQALFQSFFVTAGKPGLGLILTIAAGVTNAVFDYVFIVPMQMGIAGAAYATALGYLVPAVFGLIYFWVKKEGLRFQTPRRDWKMLLDSCLNGSSEMVTNLSGSIVTFLFNMLMMRYLGEDGVAAITIVIYAQFLFVALFLGFSSGVAPVISFNYGSGNEAQLKRVFRICILFIGGSSVILFLLSLFAASGIVGLFSPAGTVPYELGVHGFLLFSTSYLFAGVNIFASSMFTAFSDGKTSAFISFMRTLVFIVLGMLFLPRLLDVDGVWLAVPFAELCTMVLSIVCLRCKRSVFRYA